MVFSKKMRNDKLNMKQFFIYHFYDFMFFTDLDNTFTRSRALGWLFDQALQLSTQDGKISRERSHNKTFG